MVNDRDHIKALLLKLCRNAHDGLIDTRGIFDWAAVPFIGSPSSRDTKQKKHRE
jgi:hypothetical protein